MFCPACGVPNEDDAAFCSNCGASLTSDVSPEPVAEAAVGPLGPGEMAEELLPPEVMPPVEPAVLPPPAPIPPDAVIPAVVPTNGLAIASLILGVAGLTFLPLLGSILAIIFGYTARSHLRRHPGLETGEGIAMAGIVLGWIAVGLTVLALLVFGGITVCTLCSVFGTSGWPTP